MCVCVGGLYLHLKTAKCILIKTVTRIPHKKSVKLNTPQNKGMNKTSSHDTFKSNFKKNKKIKVTSIKNS